MTHVLTSSSCAFSRWMFPSYRDLNIQDVDSHLTPITSPTDIHFTAANRYKVIEYPISDAHKFPYILYTSFQFLSRLENAYSFVSFLWWFLLHYFPCAWINTSFTFTIFAITCNIIKQNKSDVCICRSLEVDSALMHTDSWHSRTFIPFIIIFLYTILYTTFKSNSAGGKEPTS